MEHQLKVSIYDDGSSCVADWACAMKKSGITVLIRKGGIRDFIDAVVIDMPDFVVMNIEMIGIIDELQSVSGNQIKIILFSSNYSVKTEQKAILLDADAFVSASLQPEQLVSRIKLMYGFRQEDTPVKPDKTKSIEYIVTDIITKIGIPASVKGYYYLRAAIILTLTDEEEMKSVTKNLYPAIAESFSTTPVRVERAIRHAVEVAWGKRNVEEIYEMFGYIPHQKPTNAEIISTISDRLRLKYYPEISVV